MLALLASHASNGMGEGRELLWPSSGNRIEQLQATMSDGGACNAISATLNFLSVDTITPLRDQHA
jgi:hypothetical protein